MITNKKVTIYHLTGLDVSTHFEIRTRYNYENVWVFGGKGSGIDKGYDNANDIQVRIPYGQNENLNIANFSIGDIVVADSLDFDIQTQQDLSNYDVYNITSLKNNDFGGTPHIHIGGR